MVVPPPAEVTDLAAQQRARQQQIAGQATAETNRLWAFLELLGWAGISLRVLSTLRAAMGSAAQGAQAYTDAVTRSWGAKPDPYGQVSPAAFVVSASDGRDLETLIEQPHLEVEAFTSQGMDADAARTIGGRHLARIVQTQVQDASRVSVGVGIVNDRRLNGYIRHLTLPSCSRCIILSGRWYRYSAGFQRHPQCDCVMLPATEQIEAQSPREVYDSLSDEERRKAGWSGHDQHAIDDGADLNQVTNYRRELKSVSVAGRTVQTTKVGTTRRGTAGRRGAKVRLTPESLYFEANRLSWTRDETIRQLRLHGYII